MAVITQKDVDELVSAVKIIGTESIGKPSFPDKSLMHVVGEIRARENSKAKFDDYNKQNTVGNIVTPTNAEALVSAAKVAGVSEDPKLMDSPAYRQELSRQERGHYNPATHRFEKDFDPSA
jgi:hypothetical protein